MNKKGKWIEIEDDVYYDDGFWTYPEHGFRCSVCFCDVSKKLTECPNCSAKMED